MDELGEGGEVSRRLHRGVESVSPTEPSSTNISSARHPAAYDKLCLYDDASDDDADRSKRKNVDEIVRDLPRTFPKHVFFHRRNGPGQRALFNVLKAVASFDPAVGYVQGMGFLAGTLLLHMPEEDAFWSLVSLLHASAHPSEPAMARLFAEGMPLLRRRCFELDRLLAIAAPRLKAHFAAEGVHPTMFASSWFTTLVSCGAPPEAAARVWDVALAEGPGVTCHRVAIALLLADADALLELPFDALVPRTRALPEKIDELFGGDLDAFLRAVGHAAHQSGIEGDG